MRYEHLDGFRGLFALSVVAFHILLIFLPAAVTGDPITRHLAGNMETVLYYCPQFLYNGNAGVCVFFVLSGFVLPIKFWAKRDNGILQRAAIGRYWRLTVPAIASIFLAYILLRLNFMQNIALANTVPSAPLVGLAYGWQADAFKALKEGLWDIYFGYKQTESYNPVLWTMETELKGSFISLSFLALFGNYRRRFWLYIPLAAACLQSYYLAFVFGLALSDFYFTPEMQGWRKRAEGYLLLPWAVLAVGVILCSYSADGRHALYEWLRFPIFSATATDSEVVYHILGAAMLLHAVNELVILRRLLTTKFFVLIGKYSFALYLVHVPILCSAGCASCLHFLRHGYPYGQAFLLAVMVSLPLIIFFAWLLYQLTEGKHRHFRL